MVASCNLPLWFVFKSSDINCIMLSLPGRLFCLLFICFVVVVVFQGFDNFHAIQQWNKLLWWIPNLFSVRLHGTESRGTSRQSS